MTGLTLNTGRTSVQIPSDTDPTKNYTVEINQGRCWWCECKSWQYGRPTGGCKHMIAAQYDLDQLVLMLDVMQDLADE